jgi:hypothetical protein
MFERFIERENTIFEVLEGFVENNISFIVVGGYAVSAYKHRFSVDADIVLPRKELEKCVAVLEKKKFVKTTAKVLEHVYASEFIRYENKQKLSVSIDLLIDGIGSRATDASFSFEELMKHGTKKKIIGREKEVECFVPSREMLVVLKLHSGRPTDYRDIVAVSKALDIAVIDEMLWRGNKEQVRQHIAALLSLLEKKEFVDSFKGVFMEKKYDLDIKSIEKLKEIMK